MTEQRRPAPEDLDPSLRDRIVAAIDEHENELISFRRRLHAHPEVSFKEYQTTEAIAERLLVEGLRPIRLDSGTGLFCDIGTDGPIIALRADIDALAMKDAKNVPYRSQNEGVAHACGHDVHTSTVLGAGLALKFLADSGDLNGRVRLIFEPGEESVPGGAIEIVKAGLLDEVDSVFSLHCDPKQMVGHVGSRVGPITSASDWVELVIHGPGGHTARPQLTVDMVDTVAMAARELPGIVADKLGGWDRARLVFGSIHAGSAANVIPARAVLSGSVRTPENAVWERFPQALDEAVTQCLADTGATWDLTHVRGVPPVENEPQAVYTVAAAARAVLGPETVGETEHSWGGDSFGWMTRATNGAYLRLGTHGPDFEDRLDLHHSRFDVDERCIAIGAKTLAASAVLGLSLAAAQ